MSQQQNTGAVSPGRRPKPPRTVQVAFWIWIASAALVLVHVVQTLSAKNAIIDELRQQKPAGLAPADYPQAAQSLVDIEVLVYALAALFFIFFAYKIWNGRNWARITVTVLTVIAAIYDIYTGLDLESAISLILPIIPVVLVYLPSAAEFFATRQRQR